MKKLTQYNYYRLKGFTLIELVLTLTIIGILTAMVTPKFSLIRTKAKEANVRTAATAIQLALESHYLTHSDYPNTQPIETLLATLQSDGALGPTQNPFTQTPYTASDSSGQLVYTRTDTGYTLTAYGHNNANVLLTY